MKWRLEKCGSQILDFVDWTNELRTKPCVAALVDEVESRGGYHQSRFEYRSLDQIKKQKGTGELWFSGCIAAVWIIVVRRSCKKLKLRELFSLREPPCFRRETMEQTQI